MPVYVDAIRPCIPNKNWRYKESCHLMADTLEELHLFAQKIGMRLSWFQDKSSLPHYDLTRRRRDVAVALGAIEITNQEVYQRILKHWQSKNNDKE